MQQKPGEVGYSVRAVAWTKQRSAEVEDCAPTPLPLRLILRLRLRSSDLLFSPGLIELRQLLVPSRGFLRLAGGFVD